ncbi:MAG: cobalamin B12-binding domain-containing protein [Burkholderiaceae bacterium]
MTSTSHGAAGVASPSPWLSRTVEFDVVPRLMLRHGLGAAAAPARSQPADSPLDSREFDAFVDLLVADDVAACAAVLGRLLGHGVAFERLCLDVLAPAARSLGDRWDDDRCDFAQVTLGLWRIQSLMLEFGSTAVLPAPDDEPGRVLLLSAIGCDHTLGVRMVAELFTGAGWDVHFDPGAAVAESLQQVRAGWFDVIGMSLGHACDTAATAATVGQLRGASRNAAITVMVGGPGLACGSQRVRALGADFAAADAGEALQRARRMLGAARRAAREDAAALR